MPQSSSSTDEPTLGFILLTVAVIVFLLVLFISGVDYALTPKYVNGTPCSSLLTTELIFGERTCESVCADMGCIVSHGRTIDEMYP